MRWEKLRRSKNVEHRRGGGGKIAMGGGLGTIVLALIAIFVLKIDPMTLLQSGGGVQRTSQQASDLDGKTKEFIKAIKGSTEDVWTELYRQSGQRYRAPKMIEYNGKTRMESGGSADARMGPFYVPTEENIYLDTSFFHTMQQTLGGGGDFAYAYVIAHEVGHHIQKLTGYTDKVHSQHGRIPDSEYNELSVRLELQADFYAGVWAHHADKEMQRTEGQGLLEEGDVEAMNAAQAIGDDTLQKQAGRRVQRETFTHGTSEQRLRWFMKGFKTGDPNQGNTFEGDYDRL
ncbi:neutral zinc metallopeptidase [Akkermansiaceae bacterium]|nr:neutral zinc metallopeptidase [Akkermansiaceae bacterium]